MKHKLKTQIEICKTDTGLKIDKAKFYINPETGLVVIQSESTTKIKPYSTVSIHLNGELDKDPTLHLKADGLTIFCLKQNEISSINGEEDIYEIFKKLKDLII